MIISLQRAKIVTKKDFEASGKTTYLTLKGTICEAYGMRGVNFQFDDLYLIRQFSEKWKMGYVMTLFGNIKTTGSVTTMIWENGNYFMLFGDALYNITRDSGGNSGVLQMEFAPYKKQIIHQISDTITPNTFQPFICTEGTSDLLPNKLHLQEDTKRDIIEFRS